MSGLANQATQVRFTLLGPLAVRNDTGTVPLGGVRGRCVLAALLLNAGKVTSIDQLIDAAWESTPPAGARVLVQNRISVLRRTLRDAGLSPELITTVGSGYVFQAEAGMLDLDLFEHHVARAEELTAAGSAAEAARELTAALALWHGPALDGLTTPPLAAAANQLTERRIRALKQRIALDLGLNRHTELVGELIGLVAEHPYQEDLRGLLMLALDRSGRQAEALRVYRDTRAVFTEQLGIEPSPSLSRLHDAILREERVSLPDLPGLPGVFGPDDRVRAVPAGPPEPCELPPPPAAFTGRDEQLRLLDSLLTDGRDSAATITTIDGMAGVGKTVLALHWAHRMADRFPDGQLHLDLRGYDRAPLRPIDALGLLLGALGQPRAQIPADLDQAAALYRSWLAGRRMLVVLDNARSVEQVRPLLPGSPGSVVLITSRDRLSGLTAREGARRITLDVLEPAETERFLALALGADRVRAEPWATAVLAAMCGYLPLALRAAAARLTGGQHTRVADLVAELRTGDRLTALAGGPDEPDPVRAALEPSYRRLPARERRLFRLLGLVPGTDFTAAAAAALAGLDPAAAESSLDQLAAAHLIEEHAPDRFRLHQLVRQYATERAELFDDATERTAAVLRLLGWYLRHARAATAVAQFEVVTPADVDALFDGPAEAAGWLEAEWGNLAAAVRLGPFWLTRLLGDLLRGYLEATVRQAVASQLWLLPNPRRPWRVEQGAGRRTPVRAAHG
jgi:DNA-binding SARP family transcriptional activator